jgi:2-polyprenyl-3-methyl-5-hydroxy-6-metoxy-1,4-benzoquinol methylase
MRDPILTIQEYNKLYADTGTMYWANASVELRPDQTIVHDILLKKMHDSCKVLDIGCYTGDLLSSLPEQFIKYGIEMSSEAEKISKEKGIQIVGNNLYAIESSERFHFIVAIDVIEHTDNPANFLNKISEYVEEDGKIIISTGNADNWLWRYLKNNFWYSKYSEHISFIGEQWLDDFCKKNNFIITEKYFFNYFPNTKKKYFKNKVKILLSLLKIQPLIYSNTTKDHFCFVLTKQ